MSWSIIVQLAASSCRVRLGSYQIDRKEAGNKLMSGRHLQRGGARCLACSGVQRCPLYAWVHASPESAFLYHMLTRLSGLPLRASATCAGRCTAASCCWDRAQLHMHAHQRCMHACIHLWIIYAWSDAYACLNWIGALLLPESSPEIQRRSCRAGVCGLV